VEETIEDEISGYIVPIGDRDAIATRLNQLIGSESLRRTFSDNARKRIETSFTAKKTANSLMKTYDTLLLLPKKTAGSITVELFIQNCKEIGYLGKKNVELENRLKRVEHLADFIQNNPLSNFFRYLRKILK